jgi:hypothetical protein
MAMDGLTICRLMPGRVLDGHVHDLFEAEDPVWPYSTHPAARLRLRQWLQSHGVKLWLPGEGHAGDDCILEVPGLRCQSFDAISENHALCLAVLLADYQLKHGRRIPKAGFAGRLAG